MSIFHRKKENDLAEEIRQHLDERVDELVESGISLGEARLQARHEFGNVALLEEKGREVWQWAFIEQFFADLDMRSVNCDERHHSPWPPS